MLVVNALTGDPLVDCSKVWRDLYGSEPPAMVGYDDSTGRVTVLLVGDPIGTGLRSDCKDEAQARGKIQGDLIGWSWKPGT